MLRLTPWSFSSVARRRRAPRHPRRGGSAACDAVELEAGPRPLAPRRRLMPRGLATASLMYGSHRKNRPTSPRDHPVAAHRRRRADAVARPTSSRHAAALAAKVTTLTRCLTRRRTTGTRKRRSSGRCSWAETRARLPCCKVTTSLQREIVGRPARHDVRPRSAARRTTCHHHSRGRRCRCKLEAVCPWSLSTSGHIGPQPISGPAPTASPGHALVRRSGDGGNNRGRSFVCCTTARCRSDCGGCRCDASCAPVRGRVASPVTRPLHTTLRLPVRRRHGRRRRHALVCRSGGGGNDRGRSFVCCTTGRCRSDCGGCRCNISHALMRWRVACP